MIANATAAAPAPLRAAALPAACAPCAILVVEDNPDTRSLVCEMLDLLDHTAVGADSAEQALGLLARAHFDTLLTDVGLPGMSGLELARCALGRQPALHIVFASGYGSALFDAQDLVHARLTKPYDVDQLQAALAARGPRPHAN